MDPLSLRTYPLAFLADLFTADMSAIRDGTITCPIVVVAGRGDPLFSFDYTQKVVGCIAAPAKELVVFDTDHHLLFNECVPLVLTRIAELITRPWRPTAAPEVRYMIPPCAWKLIRRRCR